MIPQPQSQLLERAALSAVVNLPERFMAPAGRKLTEAHFLNPHYQQIWRVCATLFETTGTVGWEVCHEKCAALFPADGPALRNAMLDILREMPIDALLDFRSVMSQLDELKRRREGMRAARVLEAICADTGEDFTPGILEQIKTLSALVSREAETEAKEIRPLVQEVMEAVEREAMNPEAENARRVRTGLRALDRAVSLEAGDLVILAGRPSGGKTALAVNLADRMSTADGEEGPLPGGKTPVLFISLETPDHRVARRLIYGRAGLALNTPAAEVMAEGNLRRFMSAGCAIGDGALRIIDEPSMTIEGLGAILSWAVPTHGFRVVIVDYLQRVKSQSRGKEARYQEVAAVSRGAKELALRHNIVIIMLAQLGRDSETRRPHKADLRESGDIECDGDHVWLLHRPSEYDASADPEHAELIVAKQKEGGKPDLLFHFHPESGRFTSREACAA